MNGRFPFEMSEVMSFLVMIKYKRWPWVDIVQLSKRSSESGGLRAEKLKCEAIFMSVEII